MPITSFCPTALSAAASASVYTRGNTGIYAPAVNMAFAYWRDHVRAASMSGTVVQASRTINLRNGHSTITATSPNPQFQLTQPFAPAATPCEFHPTSAHQPHSISHHRECCLPARLTLLIPERMVQA